MRTLTYTLHTCTVHEHRFEVPLDHGQPLGPGNPNIHIFAREVIRPGGEDLPYLLFLQGGPGGPGPRQEDFRDGWIGRALQDYKVILLDQRGTGQSTRMDAQSLAELPDAQTRADHLMLFRQDQIIGDAEVVREALAGGQQWTTLGQSYGGFLTLAYLSQAPHALRASLITGGLPGLVHIDDIYRQTYQHTAARNRAYFDRYPADERTLREIAAHLRGTEEYLPTGERLSTERLRMIGISLGLQTRVNTLHYLFEGPWVTVKGTKRLSTDFLGAIASEVATIPMYSALQEAIYACATPDLVGTATAWSADRLAEEIPGFAKNADPLDMSEPYYLTGEHMMRQIFSEDPQLRPLEDVTDILASRTDWKPVYSPDILRDTDVPVAAVIYYDDMFVPRELSLDTARLIRGCRTRITNEYQHDGLRATSGQVLNNLLELLDD